MFKELMTRNAGDQDRKGDMAASHLQSGHSGHLSAV